LNASMASGPYYHAETYKAENSIGHLIGRGYSLMLDCLEPAFADTGLTFTQWKILMNMRDGRANNPKQLCSLLRHDSGALTRLLDQLEKRELIERRRSLEDRREVELRLLPAGYDEVNRLLPMVVGLLNEAVSVFTHGEIDELIRMLTKLNVSMQGQLARSAGNPPPITGAGS